MTTPRYFWDLLWTMTTRELRVRYKNTFFGLFWLVANPLIQMIVIGYIFTHFIKAPIENYYYYLFIGLLTWYFFSTSLTKATPVIVYERSLIKKTHFPHIVIPLSVVFSNFIHFALAMIVFVVPVSFLGTLSFAKLPYLGAALFLLLLFVCGFSLLSSALNVRFRDINFMVQAMLIPWFYATPILFSISQMPENLLWIWKINPMTSILQLIYYALLNGAFPDGSVIGINVAIIVCFSVTGLVVFQKQSRYFDDFV